MERIERHTERAGRALASQRLAAAWEQYSHDGRI
jgi:hypothetical protein